MQQIIVIIIGILVFIYVVRKGIRFIRRSRNGKNFCNSCDSGCGECPLKNSKCNENFPSCDDTASEYGKRRRKKHRKPL